MFPRSIRVFPFLLATAVLFSGCGESDHPAPTAPDPGSPTDSAGLPLDTLTIDGRAYVLHVILWRSFMPGPVPPSQSPLLALVGVVATDSTPLPPGLRADSITVIHGAASWSGALEAAYAPRQRPWEAWWIQRNGPPWGPNIEIDVVALVVTADGRKGRLVARDQPIQSVYLRAGRGGLAGTRPSIERSATVALRP